MPNLLWVQYPCAGRKASYTVTVGHLASQPSLVKKKKETWSKPGRELIFRMYPAEEVFICPVHHGCTLTSNSIRNAPKAQRTRSSWVTINWPKVCVALPLEVCRATSPFVSVCLSSNWWLPFSEQLRNQWFVMASEPNYPFANTQSVSFHFQLEKLLSKCKMTTFFCGWTFRR